MCRSDHSDGWREEAPAPSAAAVVGALRNATAGSRGVVHYPMWARELIGVFGYDQLLSLPGGLLRCGLALLQHAAKGPADFMHLLNPFRLLVLWGVQFIHRFGRFLNDVVLS